ncbi:unnamed protein product [Ostreobium quekettii]|uniref:Uncharacterized protein n=1 Tax=Ostreobium quekettii TaxID=121088 RepID=A0A8S1ITQ6_9CHLO|nr:unnamed protein product [Ostreobium quekettii]|eukprot:evm.model.scf_1317.3 EVM.evm.TU.scf_1317.3   scf_1317:29098-32654(+)
MSTEKGKPDVLVETEVEGEFESLEFNEGGEKRRQGGPQGGRAGAGGPSTAPAVAEMEDLGTQADAGPTGQADAPIGPEDEALKELAAAATKVAGMAQGVARDVQQAAKNISQRWTTAVNTAAEAQSPISTIVGGLSSWWATLDPTAENGEQAVEGATTTNEGINGLQQHYGLSENEALLEQFKCKLLQSYCCSQNDYTPEMQMVFPIVLSIFEQHFCFTPEHRGKRLPAAVEHARVTKVVRKDAEGGPILDIALADGHTVLCGGFDSETALDSALALMEHLTGQ